MLERFGTGYIVFDNSNQECPWQQTTNNLLHILEVNLLYIQDPDALQQILIEKKILIKALFFVFHSVFWVMSAPRTIRVKFQCYFSATFLLEVQPTKHLKRDFLPTLQGGKKTWKQKLHSERSLSCDRTPKVKGLEIDIEPISDKEANASLYGNGITGADIRPDTCKVSITSSPVMSCDPNPFITNAYYQVKKIQLL